VPRVLPIMRRGAAEEAQGAVHVRALAPVRVAAERDAALKTLMVKDIS
jgi:hypothetical protein